jgi:hypothetical protein
MRDKTHALHAGFDADPATLAQAGQNIVSTPPCVAS